MGTNIEIRKQSTKKVISGQWEEGITGTTIKDTWTKPRGRVEVGEGGGFTWGGVEGWGEKAYICN